VEETVPRYEFSEGSSNKFWDVRIEGTSVVTTYGRIGTDGQSTMKDYDSEEQAQKEYDKLIASKTKKGYALVGGAAAAPAGAKKEKAAPKAAAPKAAAPKPAATTSTGAQRYEFSEGTSNKFWEIRIEGCNVITTYGKIGTDGQSTVKEYGSPAEAKKEHDKLVASKTKKGYELV
jgi:predicted DNA-binding WGR domain protein